MEETERRLRRSAFRSGDIGGRAASVEGFANFWRDHHVGFPRVADFDGYFASDKGAVCAMGDEVGGRGVQSSGASEPADGVDGGEEFGEHG